MLKNLCDKSGQWGDDLFATLFDMTLLPKISRTAALKLKSAQQAQSSWNHGIWFKSEKPYTARAKKFEALQCIASY